MRRIRTKQGVIRRYNAIINKLYKTSDRQGGLWDMPTLSICRPAIYLKIKILKRLYNMLPNIKSA